MQFSTFVSSTADIDACAKTESVKEVLLEPKTLAREGRIDLSDALMLAQHARTKGLSPVLVWDILMTDEELATGAKTLTPSLLENFSAIRVQCIGAAQHIKTTHRNTKIQLIAENANCNIATLQSWCRNLGAQLDKIILSIQLPAEKIAEYVQTLPVTCEILALGKILLFYSRRNLLLKNFEELGTEWREVIAASEESGNRPFPIIDNTHGTFMYLDKDQFILHKLDALGQHCPAYLRLDLRHLSEFPESAHDIERVARHAILDPEELRKSWPRPTIAPFFKSNLTTKQFKLLNSELRFSRDENCVAEIVSTERDRHCVLRAIQSFTLPAKFKVIDPSGIEISCEFSQFKYLNGAPTSSVQEDELIISPWIKKISTGSLVVKAV